MRTLLRTAVLALATAGVCVLPPTAAQAAPATQPAAAAQPTNVPVKVVVLFSSGVGYFQHEGMVAGDSTTEIRFKTNQINDILKSLVLMDRGGGKVNAVIYPSQDPISKTLRSFQVDITNNPTLADLLAQLRGAKVKVTLPTEAVEGTILGLEQKPKPAGDKGPIQVWVLNLISGAVIRSVELNDVTKLELDDVQLQQELTKALTALAQARDQDKKPVTIRFSGEGERQVSVGYVVETPVWKSTYRLILPVKPDEKPRLQGWAIVENQTDNDWNGVQLSLVSGRPISFIQDLYQPLYIPRPIVQPELYASLKPQTYDAGMNASRDRFASAEEKMDKQAEAEGEGRELRRGARSEMAARKAAPSAPPMAGAAPGFGGAGGGGGLGVGPADTTDYRIDVSKSVSSVASATKIGELFQYTVGSVTLPRQRSAMIPIVTDDVEVEKLSIYNAAVLPRNPLTGARVKNTTGKHLLHGPITVFDDNAYAGDARIDNVPPTQERLLSYGVDLQMLVDATNNKSSTSIQTGVIAKGVLILTHRYEQVQDYVAENKAEKDKTLIVEHPRKPNPWKVIAPEKPLESTDAVHRFRVPVKAGQKATLTVKEENVGPQLISILGHDAGALEVYRRNDRIPTKVREALADAIKRKTAAVDAQREVEALRRQRTEIQQDQARIRENMKALPDKTGKYFNTLMTKLATQETNLDTLAEQIDAGDKRARDLQKDLENHLLNMNVDDK